MIRLQGTEVTTDKGIGTVTFFDGNTAEVSLGGGDTAAFRYWEDFEDGKIKAVDEFTQHALNRDIMLLKKLGVLRFRIAEQQDAGADSKAYFNMKAEEERLMKQSALNEYELLRHRGEAAQALEGEDIESKISAYIIKTAGWLMEAVDDKVAAVDVGAEIDVWALGDLCYAYVHTITEKTFIRDRNISIRVFLHLDPENEGSPFESFVGNTGDLERRTDELLEFTFRYARPDIGSGSFKGVREAFAERMILSADRAERDDLAGEMAEVFIDRITKLL